MTTGDEVLAAEKSVVGAILLNSDSLRFATEHATPADFTNHALGQIYSLIIDRKATGEAIDPVALWPAVKAAGIRGVTAVELHDLRSFTPTHENIGHYARIVAEAAAKRRLYATGVRYQQLAESGGDLSEIMSAARSEWEAVRGEGAKSLATKTLAEILDAEDEYDWLIPGLLERQDRLVLTGGEGAGKSTFVRQIAIMAAAGLDPITGQHIDPIRVLVVDAENSEKQWRRTTRPLVTKARQLGSVDPAFTVNIHCATRFDIGTERDLGAIHRLIDDHQPDLLCIGPLYKLVPRAITSDDDAAPLIAGLDTLRERGCALLMEAHAGHAIGEGGQRNLRPRGSAALLGWPEFGFGIGRDPEDPSGETFNLIRWRGDRDERAWPHKLRRGGLWPWQDDMPEVTADIARQIETRRYGA